MYKKIALAFGIAIISTQTMAGLTEITLEQAATRKTVMRNCKDIADTLNALAENALKNLTYFNEETAPFFEFIFAKIDDLTTLLKECESGKPVTLNEESYKIGGTWKFD